MKVLVIGGGGRKHALVWKLAQSPRITKLYCAPGNGGIALDAECVPADVKNLDSLVALATKLQPDLTVVGPELPLTLGVVDEFQSHGWPIFGPLFCFYFRHVLPRLGGWISGNADAYRYLPESVAKFPDQESLAQEMREAGFVNVRYRNFSGGVAALHLGEKP